MKNKNECFQKSNIENEQKNNWKWQLKNQITDSSKLAKYIELTQEEKKAIKENKRLPFAVTPYYANLLKHQAIRKSVVPSILENNQQEFDLIDPLGEERDKICECIIHKYPDRVLFLVTDFCSSYCRYCTRGRIICKQSEKTKKKNWEKAIEYIKSNKNIRDVLISGGDPLTLDDEKINWLLSSLKKIKHIDYIRIGTKTLAVLPMRITDNLVRIIKKHHPIWFSLHFIHPEEITEQTKEACEKLADAGCPLGSQTVLLKGVNDDYQTIQKLNLQLMKIRVKPYYLFHCDPIKGASHFRTTIEKGLDIMEQLRGRNSGYAVPTYAIDVPSGGKIPLLPEYIKDKENGYITVKNYEGKIFKYPN